MGIHDATEYEVADKVLIVTAGNVAEMGIVTEVLPGNRARIIDPTDFSIREGRVIRVRRRSDMSDAEIAAAGTPPLEYGPINKAAILSRRVESLHFEGPIA